MWAAAEADALFPGCCPEATPRGRTSCASTPTALRTGNGYAPAAGFVVGRYDAAKAAGRPPPPFAFLDKYRTGSHLKYLHKLIDWAAANGIDARAASTCR